MRRFLFFDAFCLAAIFAMLFTVGFHIGDPKEDYKKIKFEIIVIPEKISGSPGSDNVTLIDGKYKCEIKEFGKERIVISCNGYYSKNGYLLEGAKYLSLNQPIKASQSWGYYDGRIYGLYEISSR